MPLYRVKRTVSKVLSDSKMGKSPIITVIEKVILSYTSLAHASKQIMNEENDAKKLLGISQVVEKWMVETYQSLK